jgi:hypothetical protein
MHCDVFVSAQAAQEDKLELQLVVMHAPLEETKLPAQTVQVKGLVH